MKLPNWLVSLLGVFLVIVVPPLLVLSNVNLFMTPQFVYYEYGKPDFPLSSRYEPAARTKLAVETVRYTRGELNDTDLKNLGVYNERELSHTLALALPPGQVCQTCKFWRRAHSRSITHWAR